MFANFRNVCLFAPVVGVISERDRRSIWHTSAVPKFRAPRLCSLRRQGTHPPWKTNKNTQTHFRYGKLGHVRPPCDRKLKQYYKDARLAKRSMNRIGRLTYKMFAAKNPRLRAKAAESRYLLDLLPSLIAENKALFGVRGRHLEYAVKHLRLFLRSYSVSRGPCLSRGWRQCNHPCSVFWQAGRHSEAI